MDVKGAVIKVLALVALIQVSGAERKWDDFRVTYSALKSMGYYKLPKTTSDSLIREYVKVTPETSFTFPLDFYCHPSDPRACLMFDKKGRIAGMQTSFLKQDVANVNPAEFNYTANTNLVQTNFFGIPAYSLRAYFVNPETLTAEGRSNVGETADGLWFYLDGKLVQIPRKEPEGEKFGDFYKQGCLKSMGQHWFYNVDHRITDCRKSFPLFVLYQEKDLVAYGAALIGTGTKGPKRDWYEYPPVLSLSLITPSRGKCLDKLGNKYGLTSMHVYFVSKPWEISCNIVDKMVNRVSSWLPF